MSIQRDEDLEAVYAIYRKYIEHEDSLVNHRTTWLITVQSFLLATFGFSYQKRFEVAERLLARGKALKDLGPISVEYGIFLVALALVGLITSMAAFLSIHAAVRALRSLRNNWHRISRERNSTGYLPGITGGGDSGADRRGISLSMWAPIFFCVLWLIVLVFLLFLVK